MIRKIDKFKQQPDLNNIVLSKNIQEPNNDDMKPAEDQIDKIIRKGTKRKNNFSEKSCRQKKKSYEFESSNGEVEFLEKRLLHLRERLKKSGYRRCSCEKKSQHPKDRLKKWIQILSM